MKTGTAIPSAETLAHWENKTQHIAQAMAPAAARNGKPMIFLNIGEPDLTAPPKVAEAAARCIAQGHTQYTPAVGLDVLLEKISDWYASRFKFDVAPTRIVIIAGASAALHPGCFALIDAGDEILMPDPSYPSFPPLESVTKPNLTTAEIAHYTNTRPQTWRQHACYGTGPIKPVRILGKLNWPTAQCKKLLGVPA